MTHSPDCHALRTEALRARLEWEAMHPDFCRECHGFGGHAEPGDSVPYGSTFVLLPDVFIECPTCLEAGRCPWCGDTLLGESLDHFNQKQRCCCGYNARIHSEDNPFSEDAPPHPEPWEFYGELLEVDCSLRPA